ncbi:hypothetical protein FGIG_06580 [Fasciola gigantica]|uniref:Uncharacterized protein n=1 Tax=Fasciola gigantica TaxID=46835 RepID=A0A504Z0V9_FASGI|nr:hypothetical protein FGIG_06580 [Fasciola gigantica]
MAVRTDALVGRGLETRSSISSRTRIQELKAEQLQLDMERLKIRQQKISLELENLAGSVQPIDDESTSDEPLGSVPLDSVRKYVEGCRASASHRVPEDAESRTITNRRIKLPDIELIKFDGTPKRPWKFHSSFKADVASGLLNDRERLCYLFHCSVGEAREAIEDFAMLPPKEGYVRAIDILESLFGCPGDVAECLLDEMGNVTKIKPTDITSLRKLVRQVTAYIPSGLDSWSHLKGVHFEEIKDRTVDLLIGTNTPEAHWVQDQRTGTSRQPYAVKTVLGWMLLEPTGRSTASVST